MVASVDMFGTGGEGLGGLFLGNQIGQNVLDSEAARAKNAMDMANTQSLIRQRDIGTDYENAILPDKIQAYKDKIIQSNEDRAIAKFDAQGEKFGQLSQVLGSMPAAARPAALMQMAQQAGIDTNNPMLQTLSQIDPEQLPEAMSKFSAGFYENSDKARAEKQKRDAMLAQKREELASREQQVADTNQTRRDIAEQASADRRFIAGLVQSGANSRAAAKNAGKSGGDLDKMTVDQRISYLENKGAVEGLSDAEQGALENLKQFALNKGAVPKTGSTEDIMGLPSPMERAQAAARGQVPSTTAAKPNAAPKVGTESKGYRFKGGDPSKKENWEKM